MNVEEWRLELGEDVAAAMWAELVIPTRWIRFLVVVAERQRSGVNMPMPSWAS